MQAKTIKLSDRALANAPKPVPTYKLVKTGKAASSIVYIFFETTEIPKNNKTIK